MLNIAARARSVVGRASADRVPFILRPLAIPPDTLIEALEGIIYKLPMFFPAVPGINFKQFPVVINY